MEQETLFTASKWDILTELAKEKRSPIELAEILKTSVANISQQLRLLEMAGLVKSKRISNREKGLPRVQYSLAGNLSYLIATAQEFVDKKFHKLTERNKIILRIWFLENPELHYYLEKAYWLIDEHLNNINKIYFKRNSDIRLIITTSKKINIKDFKIKNPDGKEKTIKVEVVSKKELGKLNKEKLYLLYDPKKEDNGDDNE